MALEMSRVDRIPRTYSLDSILGGASSVPSGATGVSVALLRVGTKPTVATVWTSVTYASGSFSVLWVGPDADSTGGFVVPTSADAWMKITDAPLVEAVKIERITVLGGGAPLAIPTGIPVVSINGKTGATIVLTAADLGVSGGGTSGLAFPTKTPTLASQAYTTVTGDLTKLLSVNAGATTATITLVSAATAGDGAVQYLSKNDTAAGRVIVSDGTNQLAWLSTRGDLVAVRADGGSWKVLTWSIARLMNRYTTPGAATVAIPPLATGADVALVGPGGGGGSGRRGPAGAIRTGGGGGAPGSTVRSYLPISVIGTPGGTISGQVGTGAAGGAAVTVDGTSGNVGGSASSVQRTTFGTLLRAEGGNGGTAGGTANAAGGSGSPTMSTWGSSTGGGSSSSTNASLGNNLNPGAVGAGNGGGSADAANVQRLPGIGATGSAASNVQTAGGDAGAAGNPGGAGADVTDPWSQIGGGGGGGGYYVTGAAGTAGGRGGYPGGGGGGGAASDNTFASGAGGAGADGEIRVIWIF